MKKHSYGIKRIIGYNFLPHDFLTITYFVFITFIIIVNYGNVDSAHWYILFHLAVLFFIFLLAKHDNNKIIWLLRFLHLFYPILLFTFIYQETGVLNQIFHKGYFDDLLLKWDNMLFGNSPIFWFYELFPQKLISEYFHFSYFFYYLMVPLTFVYIFIKLKTDNLKRNEYILEYMFTLCFSFYLYYTIFIYFPAVGGRTYVDIYARNGYIFKKIVDYIYLTQEIDGGAFPSSHVGIAILCLMNLKKVKGVFYKAMLILVPSLALATVYCGYHYGIDLIGGIVSGFVFYYIGRTIYRLIWG
ncbi:phosphatase PAP2 family protein [Deferribacter abyssi]|uniref:phosphatase PAP2 family protein n=1 Tax=Deferribacter abyssi TaxID=213806 RepID=UPI003C1A6212